jgi:hypothetical protein
LVSGGQGESLLFGEAALRAGVGLDAFEAEDAVLDAGVGDAVEDSGDGDEGAGPVGALLGADVSAAFAFVLVGQGGVGVEGLGQSSVSSFLCKAVGHRLEVRVDPVGVGEL